MEPPLDPALPRSRSLRAHHAFRIASFGALALLFSLQPVFAAPTSGETQSNLQGIGWKLLLVLTLVLLNGFFVATEFALVAVRKTRIDQLAAEGSRGAKAVQRAVKSIDRYIAATQVGVTVASLVLGSQGEAALEPLFDALFRSLHVPAQLIFVSRASVAVVLAYLLMTALHVILGELVPKSITLQKAEMVAMLCVRPMSLFVKLSTPLVWVLTGIARMILRVFGIGQMGEHDNVHSPEELDILVSQSHQGGELNDTEAEILHRVVRFSDLTLREVMVPRVEMQALPVEMPRLSLRAWVHSRPHSRVPVYTGSVDDVIGVVHLKDMVPFVAKLGAGDDESLVSLMPLVRETLRLPETSTVDKLLVEFKKSRQQMAIVIDEFGGTAGLITLGDLLDQVFGDMADEFDTPEEVLAHADDGRVYLAGRTLIDEINQKYETGFKKDEDDTVAGLVLTVLGRPAKVGDEVELNGIKIRVEAVERIRITRISLLLPQTENAEREAALEAA